MRRPARRKLSIVAATLRWWATGLRVFTIGRSPGPDPARRDYAAFAGFEDPDGDRWLVRNAKRG